MKKTLSFVICFLLVISLSGNCNVKAYSAKSLALCEASTGEFLTCVNAEQKLPMASTTKIMTAVVTLENADLFAKVTVPSVAVGVEGSSMYLAKDETLLVKELLYGLMLTSGNDAATALAYYVGKGNIQTFVDMMNSKAKALGLENTNFTNPSGLPDDNHFTTARELAKITCYALQNPVFAKITSTAKVKIGHRTLVNHNKMLSMYDGAIGVKTGFTKKAGRCLVSAATRNGVTLVCVTLNAHDDWNDHISALDSGFERCKKIVFHPKDDIVAKAKTPDGKTLDLKTVSSVEGVITDSKTTCKIVYAPSFVYPPKKEGEIVGSICYMSEGETVARSDLYISQDVKEPVKKQLFISRIIRFIRNLF